MEEQILELSALAPEREKARLRWPANPEGEVFELATPSDFGAVTLATMGRWITHADALMSSEKALTAAQGKDLEKTLNKIAGKLILDAPADVIALLPAVDKRSLAMRFLAESGRQMMGTMGDRLQTGASGFPAVSGSTEGTQ